MSATWTRTAALATPRQFGTPEPGVVLKSGKVLLAGGLAGRSLDSLDVVEIYDPAGGTWTGARPMRVSRSRHSSTLLNDGTVLVAGGVTGPSAFPLGGVTSTELYDPTTGSWSDTGPLNRARCYHSATLLPNGTVLVAGGWTARTGRTVSPPGNHQALRSAEIYDPRTRTWSETAPMTDGRGQHQGVLLGNGRVLVAGGSVPIGYGVDVGLSYCELFDMATSTWEATGDMTTNREGHVVTPLADGSVLATGGILGEELRGLNENSLRSAERYDPSSGAWTATASMGKGRVGHQAVRLASGKVLVSGGMNFAAPQQRSWRNAELYDPATDTWSAVGNMVTGKQAFAAVRLGDGRVLAAGGLRRGYEFVLNDVVEVFQP